MPRTSQNLAKLDSAIDLPSLPDLAYRYLRDKILTGALASDVAIRQEEIAAQLGVSRLPIREALRRLTAEGLTVLRPRCGYFVASVNQEEMDDVLHLQAVLEERAGYFAAARRTQLDIEELEAIIKKLDDVAQAPHLDIDAFARYNSEFHERLFNASGRPYLCRMLRLIQNNVERYARLGAGLSTDLKASQLEHHDILNAVRAGNPEAVALFCRTHRERTRLRLSEFLSAKQAAANESDSAA
jgi:DNA-binding GntR family transcriptional regulator